MTESNPFWAFSLDVYQDAFVQQACLEAQDRYGLEVNQLLFGFWLAGRNRILEPSRLKQNSSMEKWRTQVISGLRQVRRDLAELDKQHPL
mgnify:CR=1 FL=1